MESSLARRFGIRDDDADEAEGEEDTGGVEDEEEDDWAGTDGDPDGNVAAFALPVRCEEDRDDSLLAACAKRPPRRMPAPALLPRKAPGPELMDAPELKDAPGPELMDAPGPELTDAPTTPRSRLLPPDLASLLFLLPLLPKPLTVLAALAPLPAPPNLESCELLAPSA